MNSISKTQLAKFIETLQIPGQKHCHLSVLNLRSIPIRIHKLSPFEMITGYLIHLAPVSCDPQLVKDTCQY